MKFSYDLIKEHWIPILNQDGTIEDVGLRELLVRAHEVREIAHDSPLVVASMTTLLVALLQSAWQGETQRQRDAEWKRLWNLGRFDESILDAYFEQWSDRFDLFHEKFPFYQTAGLETANTRPLQDLAIEENNGGIFANVDNPEWNSPSPSVAAQLLISNQNFAIPGGKTSDPIVGGVALQTHNFSSGPLSGGLVMWPSGSSVFETLMLNTVPRELAPEDKPIWEQDNPAALRDIPLPSIKDEKGKTITQRKIHHTSGICDLLTLQSRMILLSVRLREGELIVDGIFVTQGRSYDTSTSKFHPFKTYVKREQRGFVAMDMDIEKAVWRNSAALFSHDNIFRDDINSLRFVSHLRTAGILSKDFYTIINVVGIAKKKAHVFLWRHDRFPVSASLLADSETESRIQAAIEDSEKMATEMKRKFKIVCAALLIPEVEAVRKKKVKNPDPKDVSKLVDKFDPCLVYWTQLETPFLEFLSQISSNYAAANATWRARVEKTATDSFVASCNSLGNQPQSIVAVAQVSHRFSLEFLKK